jgi:hypothetical protein
MAKAKRERRTSIRTMPTEGTTDVLDRLDAIERQEHERLAAAAPEDPPAGDGDEEAEGAGGDF